MLLSGAVVKNVAFSVGAVSHGQAPVNGPNGIETHGSKDSQLAPVRARLHVPVAIAMTSKRTRGD